MLMIAFILSALWLLALLTGHTMGYLIHVLLVVAIVIVLVRIVQGTVSSWHLS